MRWLKIKIMYSWPYVVWAMLQVWPSPLYGQAVNPESGGAVEYECDDEIPEHCSAMLVQGDEAPFSGILYSPALSSEITSDVEHFDRRLALEVRFEKMRCQVLTKREADLRQIEVDSCGLKQEILRGALGDAVVWYRRPVFVAVAAVVATIGMVAVTGYALREMGAR